MEPAILDLPRMTLIGLSTRFICVHSKDADNHVKIPALWDRYIERAGSIAGRVSRDEWGVCDEVPAKETKAHPDELVYLAGAQVATGTEPPPGMVSWTVPAGSYAVFTHRGSIARLGETLGWIHRPSSTSTSP